MERQTTLLYYEDVYRKECPASIIDRRSDDQGTWVALDQTIFYPGGGGQTHDLGTISGIPVCQVKKENDLVWHCLGSAKQLPEKQVAQQLDWAYRFQRMQQHSGQHLLSYILQDMQLPTVSVHLGEQITMIETDAPLPTRQQLTVIEERANSLIRERVPFRIHWTDREHIHNFPLRRPAGDWRKLRVVEIVGYDFAACGGTHVSNSSEIGLIKVLGAEKIRGHARMQFAIGGAAYRLFDRCYSQQQDLKSLLQAEADQLLTRARQINETLSSEKKAGRKYRQLYLKALAASLVEEQSAPVIFKRLEDGPVQDAEDLAKHIAKTYGRPAFICSGTRFYFPGPKNGALDGRLFLKEYGNKLQLRGGGPPDFVQGIAPENLDTQLQEALHSFVEKSAPAH